MAIQDKKLVFLGVGQVARALAEIALQPSAKSAIGQYSLYGTTRSAERVGEIRSLGMQPVIIESFENLGNLLADALVVVSFPPDPESDQAACGVAVNAASIVYISSTAVYGRTEGLIDEKTAVDAESPQAKVRLDAENKWLQVGASVIRAPGIYGRGSGLHQRLRSGNYRLPGDGSNYVSRIHVDDLAQMIMMALNINQKGRVFLSGDTQPTTHREIVEWLVNRLALPFPQSMPLDQCHYTQRGNRKIDAAKSLEQLSVTLRFPTYKEGYEHELALLPG